MHRLYLTYGEFDASIYESQVVSQVAFLNERGFNFRLLTLVSPRAYAPSKLRDARNRRKQYSELCGAKVTTLPHSPKRKSWKYNWPTVASFIRLHGVKQVFARGVYATNLAILARRWCPGLTVVYDCRGAVAAERSEYDVGGGAADMAMRRLEETAVTQADRVVCVSNRLADYLKEEFGRSDRVEVVPCCVEPQWPGFSESLRRQHRRELGIEDRDVVVFSGSMSPWQSFGPIVRVVSDLQAVNPRAFLLVLTRDEQCAREYVQEGGLRENDFRILSVGREEMPGYLSAADCGIVLREGTTTNRVASPVKIGEYLASGLPIMLSPQVGDYSELVSKMGWGTLVTEETSATQLWETVEPLLSTPRPRIAEQAREYVSRSAYTDAYERALG